MSDIVKNILITGASRGIGRALTILALSRGWNVFGVSRTPAPKLPDSCKGQFVEILGDITNDQIKIQIEQVLAAQGKNIDVLVNNAGQVGKGFSLLEVDTSGFLNLVNLMCVGPIRVTQACLKFLKMSKEPLILNISSRLGSLNRVDSGIYDSVPTSYSYRVAKAALNMTSICMARDSSLGGIKTLVIHPGLVATELNSKNKELTSEMAAERLMNIINSHANFDNATFIEPGVGELPW